MGDSSQEKSPEAKRPQAKKLVDRNGRQIEVGDMVKVSPLEKPELMAVGPVVALDSPSAESPKGLVAWTRDGSVIEKAHFVPESAEIVHKAGAHGSR